MRQVDRVRATFGAGTGQPDSRHGLTTLFQGVRPAVSRRCNVGITSVDATAQRGLTKRAPECAEKTLTARARASSAHLATSLDNGCFPVRFRFAGITTSDIGRPRTTRPSVITCCNARCRFECRNLDAERAVAHRPFSALLSETALKMCMRLRLGSTDAPFTTPAVGAETSDAK